MVIFIKIQYKNKGALLTLLLQDSIRYSTSKNKLIFTQHTQTQEKRDEKNWLD